MITRQKAKSRRESGVFLAVPMAVITSDNYRKMSAKAVKLLFDVAAQIRFRQGGTVNNGDLCITESIMKQCGWNSRDSLYKARDELIHYGFLKLTRQGGKNMPSLYALTFFAIDDSEKHCQATRTAPNDWKQAVKKWRRPRRKKLESLYRKSTNVVPINGTTHLNQRFFEHELAIN